MLDLKSEHLDCDAPIFADAERDAAAVLAHNAKRLTDNLRDSENKAIVGRWLKEVDPDPAAYQVGEELRIGGRIFMVMKINPPTGGQWRRKGWLELKETQHG